MSRIIMVRKPINGAEAHFGKSSNAVSSRKRGFDPCSLLYLRGGDQDPSVS